MTKKHRARRDSWLAELRLTVLIGALGTAAAVTAARGAVAGTSGSAAAAGSGAAAVSGAGPARTAAATNGAAMNGAAMNGATPVGAEASAAAARAANAAAAVTATPASVAIDAEPLAALDADIAAGRLPLVDSLLVMRCNQVVFDRRYPHDYGSIYYKEAHTKGPLNARLTGRYNYFDPQWHPYYHGTDTHTMQSVSKTRESPRPSVLS